MFRKEAIKEKCKPCINKNLCYKYMTYKDIKDHCYMKYLEEALETANTKVKQLSEMVSKEK